MNHTLTPTLTALASESVLFQAWKKTEAYIRSHNWYADTMELDWQALRLPEFIADIQQRVRTGTWTSQPLRMVPAPKPESWETDKKGNWLPSGTNKSPKIRPLAHVALEDQVICTAVMLCLADRVESEQSDPSGGDTTPEQRKRLLSYGHRLFCRVEPSGRLRHAWAAKKLYRLYSTDYRRFLARPDNVAADHESNRKESHRIAIVTADISRFYDRVRPSVLRKSILALKRHESETSFFAFVDQLFGWEWDTADTPRVREYSKEVEGFEHIALPQGLVAAGFFANVVLLGFDSVVSDLAGKRIRMAPEVKLLDVCRYVDDLRLVLQVPAASSESDLKSQASEWLNKHLKRCAPGLLVEPKKTQVVVRGGEEHSIIPQSRAAERIQQTISGGFDFEQGMHIMDALDGFLNTQHRYSPSAKEQGEGVATVLRGVSDMRDDTAARFAAARYRKTFRSLRPLLDAEVAAGQVEGAVEDDEDDDPITGFTDAVISRSQFDERGLLFARELLAAWEGNPAHVRLMRIAVDLFPRPEFCTRILERLRPSWTNILVDARRREVMHYCLAELFRAGATETGIVRDLDELPDSSTGTDVAGYHDALLEEGRKILRSAAKSGVRGSGRFPWYLLQQVMLYLATRQESLEGVDMARLPGAKTVLRRSIEVYEFYTDKPGTRDVTDEAQHIVLQATSFARKDEMVARAAKHSTSDLLSALANISPSFSEAVWHQMTSQKRRSLAKVAQIIGLNLRGLDEADGMTCVVTHAGLQSMIWHEEYNLVVLAHDLLQERMKKRDGVLTPWRIVCDLSAVKCGPVSLLMRSGSLKVIERKGGEALFALPDWCETEDERLRVETGQVLRYLFTGSIDYFRPVRRHHAAKNLPQYRRSQSSWELGRYGSFNGRTAFGPDWLPLSSWAESLLIELLRWPGCGAGNDTELTAKQILKRLSDRKSELEKLRGTATGMLFLEQEAKWPHKKPQKKDRPLRIAVVQSIVPDVKDFEEAGTGDLQLNGPDIRRKHRNHLRRIISGLHKMLGVRVTHLRGNPSHRHPHLDWVIFPELAVHPDDVDTLLIPLVQRYKCIVLAGLVYHPLAPSSTSVPLINSALWLIPEWSPSRGFHVRRFEQGKANLAPETETGLQPSVIGHRPAQWIIRYHWKAHGNVRPLLLSAAVCYDATDTALAHDLRNRNDLFAVCALNRDVPTYDKLAETLNYLLFQGVIVANNGSHGGSSVFAPLKESYQRELIHFHGQEQAAIAFAEVHPPKLIRRPDDTAEHESPLGKWKKRPAGWRAIP